MTSTETHRRRFLVCEDGSEYLERFERFFGAHYDFVRSQCASELVAHLTEHAPVVAVLLDLDFRRTELSKLIDGEGQPLAHASNEERTRLITNQGIAILSHIRRNHDQTPVLLFADITSAQHAFLEQRFSPLTIVPSHASLRDLQHQLDSLAFALPRG